MLGEDDAFKVVLDPAHDPGADKRGLLWSGQVPASRGGHRRSLLPAVLAEFLPQRRWHRRGSTRLVYRYLPRRSNLRRRTARPSRERPAGSRLPPPVPPPRTRSAQCRAADKLPARDPPPAPSRRSRNSGTSEPTCAAISSRLAGCPRSRFRDLGSARHSRFPTPCSSVSSPTSAATAFADPAPSPPCTGSRFSIWISTAAEIPSSPSASSTIFHAVLRPSVGTRRSFEVIRIAVAPAACAETVTRSCISSV